MCRVGSKTLLTHSLTDNTGLQLRPEAKVIAVTCTSQIAVLSLSVAYCSVAERNVAIRSRPRPMMPTTCGALGVVAKCLLRAEGVVTIPRLQHVVDKDRLHGRKYTKGYSLQLTSKQISKKCTVKLPLLSPGLK